MCFAAFRIVASSHVRSFRYSHAHSAVDTPEVALIAVCISCSCRSSFCAGDCPRFSVLAYQFRGSFSGDATTQGFLSGMVWVGPAEVVRLHLRSKWLCFRVCGCRGKDAPQKAPLHGCMPGQRGKSGVAAPEVHARDPAERTRWTQTATPGPVVQKLGEQVVGWGWNPINATLAQELVAQLAQEEIPEGRLPPAPEDPASLEQPEPTADLPELSPEPPEEPEELQPPAAPAAPTEPAAGDPPPPPRKLLQPTPNSDATPRWGWWRNSRVAPEPRGEGITRHVVRFKDGVQLGPPRLERVWAGAGAAHAGYAAATPPAAPPAPAPATSLGPPMVPPVFLFKRVRLPDKSPEANIFLHCS